MKIILTTLNSKYIHTNLALRYLKAYSSLEYPEIEILEYTINDQLDRVIGELVLKEPDMIGFSCYIWNIEKTLLVVDSIKKIKPECKILLGGPEVSYDGVDIMKEHLEIDYIITGEGEEAFKELWDCIKMQKDLSAIKGLIWRSGLRLIDNGTQVALPQLDKIPFPYPKGFEGMENKIIYYETSRGCPYQCQYCLSSVSTGVRFLPMERIHRDIKRFVDAGVPQVKLVDRTFNCNPHRALEIFKLIIETGGSTNFHFEMAGDLIDKETLAVLSKAPKGLFQFELGIQSTNKATLEEVKRRTDLNKLSQAVISIIKYENINIHLDLIAGLPGEGYTSTAVSFNEVMYLKPDRLQLGFLKLLKGSGLREHASNYGYRFTSYPPYEVLCSDSITYDELWRLKRIEELLEHYYNAHRFDNAIDYLIQCFDNNPFNLFEDMMAYWVQNAYYSLSHNKIRLYEILLSYAMTKEIIHLELFREILLFDYVRNEKPSRYPEGLMKYKDPVVVDKIHSFLRNEDNVEEYIPYLRNNTVKQIIKRIHVEVFQYDVTRWKDGVWDKPIVLLFDYTKDQKTTKLAKYNKIEIF